MATITICSYFGAPKIKSDTISAEAHPNLNHHRLGFLLLLAICILLKVKVNSLSCVQLFATLWTIAHQAPPSMGFSRPEY